MSWFMGHFTHGWDIYHLKCLYYKLRLNLQIYLQTKSLVGFAVHYLEWCIVLLLFIKIQQTAIVWVFRAHTEIKPHDKKQKRVSQTHSAKPSLHRPSAWRGLLKSEPAWCFKPLKQNRDNPHQCTSIERKWTPIGHYRFPLTQHALLM